MKGLIKRISTASFTTTYLSCLVIMGAFYGTAQADIIGIDFTGPVVDIDSGTGAAVPVGPSGINSALNAMARHSDGTIYSAGGTGLNGDSGLYTINPLTGASSITANLNFGIEAVSVRGMSFSAADALFAVNNGGGVGAAGVTDNLFTVDITTGIGTLIGATTGFGSIQGLAHSLGILYAWDTSAGLLTIDPLTGLATDVNLAVGGFSDIQTLAFASDGTLFGANSELYSIDITTGMTSLVGSGGYADVRGMVFGSAPANIPEPTSVALFALALGGLGIARQRRANARND